MHRDAHVITAGYDGVEGYLGESYCEDVLGMVQSRRNYEDVDGYVGKVAVQSNFKRITRDYCNTRWIQLRKDPGFHVLVVTYAEPGASNVQLFGKWSQAEVLSAAKPYKTGLRVRLAALSEFPQYCFPDFDCSFQNSPDCSLVHSHVNVRTKKGV